jgi:hypothetical protein
LITDDEFSLLLDEMVLLYSHIGLSDSVTTQMEEYDIDIQALRKRELTNLMEDTVWAYQGPVIQPSSEHHKDDNVNDDNDGSGSTSNTDRRRDGQTLGEISLALDEAILMGYQSTFTPEELDDWVKRIESLHTKYDEQLKMGNRLFPADDDEPSLETVAADAATTTTSCESTITIKEVLQSQLESLRILVDPMGKYQRHMPVITTKTDIIESRNPALSLANQDDNGKDQDNPDISLVASDTVESTPSCTSSISSGISVEDAISELAPASSSVLYASEATALTVDDETTNAAIKHQDTADVVGAVVSVAALSAAAVTKIPFFVAGVALAPAIQSSIAYAKGRMNAAASTNDSSNTSSSTLSLSQDDISFVVGKNVVANSEDSIPESTGVVNEYQMLSMAQNDWKKNGSFPPTTTTASNHKVDMNSISSRNEASVPPVSPSKATHQNSEKPSSAYTASWDASFMD